MGSKGAITLDNQFYVTGQTIYGRIDYLFDSPKRIKGITVQFKGQGHTEFYKQREYYSYRRGRRDTEMVRHYGNEEYFDVSYHILGNQQGGEIDIPAGNQMYYFVYTLPAYIPSSFEGRFGYIRYTVKVTLILRWKFNQETIVAFTVMNVFDLNLNPTFRHPLFFQLQKKFCCLCCTSAPLSVVIQTPVSGYCPGQVMPFQIDIENKSNVHLRYLRIIFRRVVVYRSLVPASTYEKVDDVLHTIQEGPVPSKSTKHWNLNLQIPAIPPSNHLHHCNLMDLNYYIQVQCLVNGPHKNMSDRKFVTIGTVPLVFGDIAPPASLLSGPTSPTSPASPAVLPVTPGIPPQP